MDPELFRIVNGGIEETTKVESLGLRWCHFNLNVAEASVFAMGSQ